MNFLPLCAVIPTHRMCSPLQQPCACRDRGCLSCLALSRPHRRRRHAPPSPQASPKDINWHGSGVRPGSSTAPGSLHQAHIRKAEPWRRARNNLGNVYMATGRYAEAVAQYTRAVQLAPAFSFAAANKTLGLYAAGRTDQAMREMRCAPAKPAAPAQHEVQGRADA